MSSSAWAPTPSGSSPVGVLLRTYVKCIAGRDEINRRRIEDALRDDDLDDKDDDG
jgi:hypothetical protein